MRWIPWPWRRRREREIDEEIAAHLAMAARDRIERGEPADAARDAALREFGNVPLVQDATRRVWGSPGLEPLLQDVRFGSRILRQSPGLSATAVLLAALVIGGNTTIYSIVNGILVSPAAGITADRLVVIRHADPGVTLDDPFISFPNFEDYARRATTVTDLLGWSNERLTLGSDAGNYAVFGSLVTANYFRVFGVGTALGRALQDGDDDGPSGLPLVISHRLWNERFGGAADVVGRTVMVNRVPATIVGVAAPGFAGATLTPGEDLWLPLRPYYAAINSTAVLADRVQPLVVVGGRLAAKASLRQARAEFATLSAQLHAAYPDTFMTYSLAGRTLMKDPRAEVLHYSSAVLLPVGQMAGPFLAIFSIVTLLTLVVVSANVANLMLGRAIERQRDTAVRRSLGASQARILRVFVAEGATLALIAWGLACVCAWWTARLALQVIEPRPGLMAHVKPDWTMAPYALLLAGGAMIALAIAPGLRAWRAPVLPLLKAGESSVARGRSRLASSLVVLQLAFSVLLVTSAALAYRSLSLLDSGAVGFDPDPLLLVTVRARQTGAFIVSDEPSPAEREAGFALLERVRDKLSATPLVAAATYTRRAPGPVFLATTPVRREGSDAVSLAFLRPVGPDYLRTLGLAPIAGRELTAADRRGGLRTAVVNRELAATLFAGESPLGRVLVVGPRREAVEIVGVSPDARFDGPVHDPRPRYVFVAEQQMPGAVQSDPTFLVRHTSPLDTVTTAVGRAIAEADPALPIVSMSSMTTRLESVTVIETMVTRLLVGFALLSLLVAGLGQYAVALFNMRRRTRDFGVRMALGASSARIQREVVHEALRSTIAGLAIGFLLSLGIATAAQSVLFGVTPSDPLTYVAVCALLAATSLAASYLPAWRAGRVNVVDALRQE